MGALWCLGICQGLLGPYWSLPGITGNCWSHSELFWGLLDVYWGLGGLHWDLLGYIGNSCWDLLGSAGAYWGYCGVS